MEDIYIGPSNDLTDTLFITWSEANCFVDELRQDLSVDFDILADVEISWTKENIINNVKRLYGKPLYFDDLKEFEPRKTSGNKIHVFYVKQRSTNIVLHRSASGEFERVSLSSVKNKEKYRKLAYDKFSYPYMIHSASTIEELRLQTPLLLGMQNAMTLWIGERMSIKSIDSDLQGANGWASLKSALEHLSLCTDWCVLRGWDELEDGLIGDDLDILVADKDIASSALGLLFKENDKQMRNGYLQLQDGTSIKVDLHWVGDGYFDTNWQKDILKNSYLVNEIKRPDEVNALFSLIYNEFVNRTEVRENKILSIKKLAQEVSHSGWLKKEIFDDENKTIQLLVDYMYSNGYVWTLPLVKRHDQAHRVINRLPRSTIKKVSFKNIISIKVIAFLKKNLPKSWITVLVTLSKKLRR